MKTQLPFFYLNFKGYLEVVLSILINKKKNQISS